MAAIESGDHRYDPEDPELINALWTLALVAALRHGEAVRGRQVAGFVLGLIGCIVLFAPWDAHAVDTLGATYCLFAALSYAVSYVYMARYLAPRNLTPTVLSAAQLTAATGWTLLALVPRRDPTSVSSLGPWLALVVLGIAGTGGAYIINYALIRSEGATGASAVTYLLPVVSVAIGAALLTEPLTLSLVVGTTFIIAGVAASRVRSSGPTT